MSTRTYGGNNIINIIDASMVLNATLTWDNFNAAGIGNVTGPDAAVVINASKQGQIDFAGLIPVIPDDAIITKVRLTGTRSQTANCAGSTSQTAYVRYNIGFGPYITDYAAWVVANPPYRYTEASTTNSDGIADYTDVVDMEYGGLNLTRDELIAQFGTVYVIYQASAGTSGITGTALATVGSEGWQLTITYTRASLKYTTYYKPTEVIVGGLPVKTIANPLTDIIEVPEGTPESDIPEGFEFLWFWWELQEEVWWETNEVRFFIKSKVPPGPKWKKYAGIGNPNCVGCLTIMLGELEVLLANASGIYVLQPGKRTDTLYDRESEATREVRIPDPQAKTGFVP